MVDQGPSLRRYMPRAMGRAFKILKKTSHISLTISDETSKKKRS
jgi:large subunit ribosomal protein L22